VRISKIFKGQTTWQPNRKGCTSPKVCLGEKMAPSENILRKKKLNIPYVDYAFRM